MGPHQDMHQRAVASLVHLVRLLAGDLGALSPRERGDILARALAAGVVEAYRDADMSHVIQRLRRTADWLEGKACGASPAPPSAPRSEAILLPSPEAVPGALAAHRGRRAA